MKKVLLLGIVMIILCTFTTLAAGENIEQTVIPVVFESPDMPDMLTWNFTYTDDYFSQPATDYNHTLAQCSLGLNYASFRKATDDLAHKDKDVVAFITAAGFEHIVSEEYNIEPSIETVATAIGSKTIGDSTLLVIAVSGAGYKKEWASNVAIMSSELNGQATFHDGFAYAAQKVTDRVQRYVSLQNITGNVKIWITGFSRAAAVVNLTTYMLLDSGFVVDEDIYAYTFATPRCTSAPDTRQCPSIFNIVGSFDVVPTMPFYEWGYERYGTTLYLPAQELCEDYDQRRAAVEPIYKELTGISYFNNLQCNWLLLKVIQSLDAVMTNANEYRSTLQDILVKTIDMPGSITRKLLGFYSMARQNEGFMEMMRSITFNTEQMYSAFAYSVYRQMIGAEPTQWQHGTTPAGELIHEHCMDVYLSWMYSQQDSEKLFVDCISYHQLSLPSDAQVVITDDTGAVYANPAKITLGDICIFMLPGAREYTLDVTMPRDYAQGLYVAERVAQHIYTRYLLFYDENMMIPAGSNLRLIIPAGTDAPGEQFVCLCNGESIGMPIDTKAAGFTGGIPELDTTGSGTDALQFLSRAITMVIIVIALLLLLVALLLVLLIRRLVRRRKARNQVTVTDAA